MNKSFRNCCLLVLLWTATGNSQSAHFRFQRQLLPGGPGPNRIAPDATLLSGAAFTDLRDLRFYDSAGREVPYLLIPPENSEAHWRTGRILSVASTKTTSGFEVDLGSAAPIDRLRLAGIPAPFLKRFRLEGGGDRSHWTLLAPQGTLFDLPGEGLRMTEVEFTAGAFRYLRVTWDDRESGVVAEPRSASARLAEPRAASASLRAQAEFKRLSARSGASRFQVRLPGPHLPLTAVELSVAEERLLRRARVTESKLSGAEVVPQTLGLSMLHRVVQGNLTAADLRIPIRAPEGREIEIVVEDDDNPPLNLTGVTLEFGPQPWIYLESPGDAPLVARYGDPRLGPPKYDLEAVRQYVGSAGLKEARWGESRDSQPADSLADEGIQPQPGAPIDPKAFRFSRKIPESPAGLTALVLDAAVLAHTGPDLADLRIADAGDHQIPYLLERRQDVLTLDLSLVPDKSKPAATQSRYNLALPFENLPAAKLVLTTPERTFQRKISIEVRRPAFDARSEPFFETLAATTWRHNDPESPAPPLMLDLRSSLGTASATLTVDEGDNRPLPLGPAHLELPLYRLRFFCPADAKLKLLYGQDGLAAPRYDLELLAPRLVGVSSRELTLDPENNAPLASPKNPLQTRVFWAALVVSVVVVLFLLVRLLRSEHAGHA